MITPIETIVTEITVYQSQARLIRQGTIALEAGEHTLVISSLPNTLIEDLVHVSVREPAVRILAVEVLTRANSDSSPLETTPLKDRLAALKTDDKQLARQETLAGGKQTMLTHLGEATSEYLGRAVAENSAGPERIEGVAQYLDHEVSKVLLELEELGSRREALKQEITSVQNELEKAESPFETKKRREIHILVEVTAAASVQLTVTCVFREATWNPIYELRVQNQLLHLTYAAQIRQRTGADWPALPLTLSTERTSRMIDTTSLSPWQVDIREKPEERIIIERGRVDTGTPVMALGTRPLPPLDRDNDVRVRPPEQAQMVDTGPSVSFATQRGFVVHTDYSPQRIVIADLDLPVELDYASIPRLSEQVLQRAKMTNTSALPLLPGQGSLFYETGYIGSTRIGAVAPGEQFIVNLGVEDRIRIRRQLVKHELITVSEQSVRRLLHTYRITVTNHLDSPARVTVRDQWPMAVHGDIQVELQSVSPEPEERSETNVLKWRLSLQPQESAEITFTFVVEYPRDREITGIL